MPTSVYGLRFPTADDSPNGPQQIQDLAEDVESTLQNDLELGGSLELPGTLETGSSVTVGGNLNLTGVTNFSHTRMRPKQATSSTDITGVTSTTPAAGSPVVGVAFEAPPSGMVYVEVTGRVRSTQNTCLGVLGWQMRVGSSIGAGSVVSGNDASIDRAVTGGAGVVTDGPAVGSASNEVLIEGLTPGSAYNVQTMHWADGTTRAADFLYRAILVKPVF